MSAICSEPIFILSLPLPHNHRTRSCPVLEPLCQHASKLPEPRQVQCERRHLLDGYRANVIARHVLSPAAKTWDFRTKNCFDAPTARPATRKRPPNFWWPKKFVRGRVLSPN